MTDILIVGAGIAGFTAAQEIHKRSPSTSVLLVDAEARLPYKRTKLSKLLAEGFSHDAFALEDSGWYDRRATLKTGCEVTAIDAAARTARLSDGSTVAWKKLLLATGAKPVLPAAPGVGEWLVFYRQDDAERLRARWQHEREVAVLGNGVLGVEIAEQAVLAGKRVRLWSSNPLPLHRELTPQASRLLAETLARHGVVQEAPQSERAWAVAAIGSVPDLSLAQAAGLAADQGVLVDEAFRTSVEGIWAAGDGVQLPGGRVSHLWHESEAQGKAAALSMLGAPSFSPRPWRLKCDVFGTYWFSMNKPRDRAPDVEALNGNLYRAFWYDQDRLTAAVMANDKDNNKLYEKAVVEGWTRGEVERKVGR